jgi:hypothetical protein
MLISFACGWTESALATVTGSGNNCDLFDDIPRSLLLSLSLSLHYKRFVPNRFGLNRDGRALSRRSLFMYLSSTLCFCSCTCPAYDQDIASCSVGADECAVSFEPGAQFSLSIWTVTRRLR